MNPALRLTLLMALATSGCAVIGPPFYRVIEPPLSCANARGYNEEGAASWYGRGHHGRRTASGESFDMNGLTAAHRRLPLGSTIRVTNLTNGRSVVLKVNDRGPFVMGRFLDVSHRAAEELNFVRAGVAPVRVETIDVC